MEKEIQEMIRSGMAKIQKSEEDEERKRFLKTTKEMGMEADVASVLHGILPEVLRKYVKFKDYSIYGKAGRLYYYLLSIPGIYPMIIEVPVQLINDMPYVKVVAGIMATLNSISIPIGDLDILLAKAAEYQLMQQVRKGGET